MRTFNIFIAARIICLLCFAVLAHPVLAQTENTVANDTLTANTTAVNTNVTDTVAADTTNTNTATTAKVQQKTPAKRKYFIIARISSKKILNRMPQYHAVQRNMEALKAQYEAEAQKSEADFQRKFEEFMEGHKEFPKTIMEKRQNELQSMLETNAEFRIKVQKLLVEAEKSLMADVMAEMNDAIITVSQEKGVSIVFDTDGGSVPYITPALATDITHDVLVQLGIETIAE